MSQAPCRYPYQAQPLSKADLQNLRLKPWQQLAKTGNDPLAFRWYILLHEGRECLINIIRGAHGLSNRY